MNQTQQLIDSIRDAPHDTVIVAGMFAIPVLIALWIVNRMRHPERGLLHALVIASVGLVLVPCVSSAVLILWVRTGGDSIQAAFVSMFVFVFGFWGFRRWLRSAPRAAKPTKALVAPAVHAAPRSGLAGEVGGLVGRTLGTVWYSPPSMCPPMMRSVGWSGTRFSMTPSAKISNPHTRRAYARPVGRFLAWCEEQGIELRQVTPGLAGRFIEELPGSDPTRNLALAALRHFFDALVTCHAVALNPFSSVRGKKHSVVDGKTPELSPRAGAGIARFPGPLSRGGVAGSVRAGRADLHRGAGGSHLSAAARGSPGTGDAAGLAVPGKGRQAARDSGAA